MTVQALIDRLAPELMALAAWMESLGNKYPDLKPEIDPKVATLRSVASPEALASIGTTVISELTTFVQQGIREPRQHPSDLA